MDTLGLEIFFLELFESCKTVSKIERMYDLIRDILDYAYEITVEKLEDGE